MIQNFKEADLIQSRHACLSEIPLEDRGLRVVLRSLKYYKSDPDQPKRYHLNLDGSVLAAFIVLEN